MAEHLNLLVCAVLQWPVQTQHLVTFAIMATASHSDLRVVRDAASHVRFLSTACAQL